MTRWTTGNRKLVFLPECFWSFLVLEVGISDTDISTNIQSIKDDLKDLINLTSNLFKGLWTFRWEFYTMQCLTKALCSKESLIYEIWKLFYCLIIWTLFVMENKPKIKAVSVESCPTSIVFFNAMVFFSLSITWLDKGRPIRIWAWWIIPQI